MLDIKRIGIGYYELVDGSIVDRGLYDLALFLEEMKNKLKGMYSNVRSKG